MNRELWARIAVAFYTGAATIDEQDLLNTAAAGPGIDGFDDLPEQARQLLLQLEQRGRNAGVRR